MRRLTCVAIACLMAGCQSGPSQVVTTVPPLSLPGQSDAVLAAELLRGIELDFGTPPRPSWYQYLHLVNGQPDVAVDGGVLFVTTLLPASDAGCRVAVSMCHDVATAAYTDAGQPVQFLGVAIESEMNVSLANCSPPVR